MKKCNSCGYEDKKDGKICPVCESPLVFACSEHKEKKSFKKYFALGFGFLISASLAFFIHGSNERGKDAAAQKLPVYPYEEKMEKSIRALSGVIIPDYTEQEAVFAYLKNGSPRLKLASCETLIYWAAYSKTSRQLYLEKAAQPLYEDFDKKGELIDMFTYFLSMKTFLPREFNFMLPQLSSIARSKDYETAQKALRLALMTDTNAGLCWACESISSAFKDFDKQTRDICSKSCSKS